METNETQIPTSFDDFLNPNVQLDKETKTEKESLNSRFSSERNQWTAKVKNFSENFKSVLKTSESQTTIYTERQIALEYYHYLISLLIKLNLAYRKAYALKYHFYSFESQKRFPNEASKNNQILSEIEDIIEKREALDNHSKFMDQTLRTLDNIIFGIKYRIDFENIARGK